METKSTLIPKEKRRVYLVDDHPLMREGLKRLINHETDLKVCGESGDVKSGLTGIEKARPDIAIIDLTLENSNGIDLVKNLKKQTPKLPILVLTMHDESLYAERSIRAGARGYIMKQEASEKVLDAIRKVLQGNIYLGSEIQTRLTPHLESPRAKRHIDSPIDTLSNRELQVFEMIGRGNGTRQISHKLNLSIKTIETNRARIKVKLKLNTALQLVHHAIQWIQDSEKK